MPALPFRGDPHPTKPDYRKDATLLEWSEVEVLAALPDRSYIVRHGEDLYRSLTGPGSMDLSDKAYVSPETEHRWGRAWKPVTKAEAKAAIEALCASEAARAAGPKAYPTRTRPVSKDYTLPRLLAVFDRAGVVLSERGGRALLSFPPGDSRLMGQDIRHAMTALAPLLDGEASGKRVTCQEPKCRKPADTILFPDWPACERHSALVTEPATVPEPVPYWKVPRLSVSPAGARYFRLGTAPDVTTDKPAAATPAVAIR